MVKIALQFKAQLDNITELRPEGEDFRWYLKLRCANCGEENPKWVYCSLEEKMPIKGSRGEACMVAKCHLCGRENSINIMADSVQSYNVEDSESFKTIVVFDCRGVEPFDFSPRVGFTAKSASSTKTFQGVDLKENEWTEYDDISQQPVGVFEVSHRFTKA